MPARQGLIIRALTCGYGIGFSATLFTHSDEAATVIGVDPPRERRRPAMIKNALAWPGIAFLIFFIASNPDSAAPAFESLRGTTTDVAGRTSSRCHATV